MRWITATMFGAALAVAPAVGATEHSGRPEAPAGKMDTGSGIEHSVVVACDVERAFDLWLDPEALDDFLGPVARLEPRVGGAYELAFFPEDDPEGDRYGTRGARILRIERPHRLEFEWVAFVRDDGKGAAAPPAAPALRDELPPPTWVEVTVRPLDAGAEVRLRHLGFREGPLWMRSRDWFDPVWARVLERLREFCAAE